MRINRWALLLALLSSSGAVAENWEIEMPWQEPASSPPQIKPFQLPTLKGRAPHYNTPTPALKPAPNIDPDAIFKTVLSCYPEKSKFNLDLSLVAGMKTNLDEYQSDG